MQVKKWEIKRGLSLILAIVMLLGMFQISAFATVESEGVQTEADLYVSDDVLVEEQAVEPSLSLELSGIMPTTTLLPGVHTQDFTVNTGEVWK